MSGSGLEKTSPTSPVEYDASACDASRKAAVEVAAADRVTSTRSVGCGTRASALVCESRA
jgi:hypothetical protein